MTTENDLPAGNYLAQVEEWAITESKNKKTLQVNVKFKVAGTHTYYWTGMLEGSDKAKEITVKALRTMGFDSNNESDLLNEDALDKTKELNVKLEYDTWEGKTIPRINWVNEVGTGMRSMEKSDATTRLKQLNLKSFLMAEPAKRKPFTQETSDIPF